VCADNKTTTIYIFLFLFLTFTSFITAFFSFSLTCSLYLHHISISLLSLLKPDAVQLQVHAVNHRHSRGKQAEPGKLATPRTTSHGVTPANRMDVTVLCIVSVVLYYSRKRMQWLRKRRNIAYNFWTWQSVHHLIVNMWRP